MCLWFFKNRIIIIFVVLWFINFEEWFFYDKFKGGYKKSVEYENIQWIQKYVYETKFIFAQYLKRYIYIC